MTALQEAAMRKAILLCEWIAETPHQRGSINGQAAQVEYALRTALAQQGEQQPVAWYEYNQDLDAWFLAYGHNPKAKTRPLVFGDTAAPAPQAQPMTDPCKTCSHFKEGNLPGVRIHDETCYECRSYWGNKWEAA